MDKFFDMLCRNDDKEIEEFLLSKGKNPKPVCPIMFIKEEDKEVEENKND